MAKIGRNDPCFCGSGKKYKHCCLGKEPRVVAARSPAFPDSSPPLIGSFGDDFGADPFDDDPIPPELAAVWPDESDEPDVTPIGRAYNLAFQGWDVKGAARIELAKQALGESPDCVEAYNLLGSAAPTPEKAIPFYEQALEVADRVLGAGWWDDHPRRDWFMPDAAESALDARVYLGRALMQLGRTDDAIERFRSVLTFDPDDEDGVRYYLLDALLDTDRDDEAMELIEQYPHTPSSRWPFARALLKFRREGDTLWAQRALVDALAYNPRVAPHLLGQMPPPGESPLANLLGDDDSIDAARDLDEIWHRTPGAIDWLQAIFAAGPDAGTGAAPRGDGPTLCHTPSDALGYIRCPRCQQKTKPRKREVVILIEPDELAAVRLACRHCENCDILSILSRDLSRGTETVMRSRGRDVSRYDYLTLGIVDPAVTESRPAGAAKAARLEDHLLRWRDEMSAVPELDNLFAGFGLEDTDLFEEPDPAGVIDVPFTIGER